MDKYTFNRYLKERSETLLAECRVVLGGICVKCGSRKSLEFDHIDPETKEFEISRARSVSYERLMLELVKCQLLCTDCHKIKHASQHGSLARYKKGCRCVLCVEVRRAYFRAYYHKRKKQHIGDVAKW